VLDEHPVEEGLVAILEGGQPDEPLEVVALAPVLLDLQLHLLLDREHPHREEPVQAERVALPIGERRVLVQERVLEQLGAAVRNRRRPGAGLQRVDPSMLEGPVAFQGRAHAATTSFEGSSFVHDSTVAGRPGGS